MSMNPLFGSAAILAGGKSSRMGFDKQLLTVNQRRLIDITVRKLQPLFDDIIVVTANPEYYEAMPITAVKDNYPGLGPLAGIEAALSQAKSQYVFTIACDMPNFCETYARFMQDTLRENNADSCITTHGDWIEPFHAYYGKTSLAQLRADLSEEKGSIYYFLRSVNTLYIDEHTAKSFNPHMDMFANLNTRHEYEEFVQKTLG